METRRKAPCGQAASVGVPVGCVRIAKAALRCCTCAVLLSENVRKVLLYDEKDLPPLVFAGLRHYCGSGSDDGIGMSEEFQKTLFDPFTREEKSGTNKVQGTGLGMAITRSIVDLMGGSIRVESAPGRGTRFEVVLEFPIDTESDHAQKVQALPEEAEETSPLSGMKFLCAEDNAINAEILQMLLESKGAHCKIYPNGQEIVDAFASVKPGEYDMILMDVQMPVMDGLEATRRIRNGENPLGRIIPILAMTANAFLEDMQKSKEAGMDEHLSKPVDISALEQTVKRFRVTSPH